MELKEALGMVEGFGSKTEIDRWIEFATQLKQDNDFAQTLCAWFQSDVPDLLGLINENIATIRANQRRTKWLE